jgi:hypothetical protein
MAPETSEESRISTLTVHLAKFAKAVIQFDLLLLHVSRMQQITRFHKYAHPLHISLFSAQATVFVMNLITDLIQQP